MRFNGLFCKILKPGIPPFNMQKNEALNYFRSKVDHISNMGKYLTISSGIVTAVPLSCQDSKE